MTSYHASDPQAVRLSVSAVIRREAGAEQLLLMQRSDNGLWGLPGGYVEPGESVMEAVAREVGEETGVRVFVGRLVGVYSDPARQVIAYPDGNRVQAVNLCFEALEVERGEATTPEESLGSGYFPFDALPEALVPIHAIRIADACRGCGEACVR
ncbi:MAG: NUDIX domain-containing protein [Myxococcota bacterium]